jgi:hypothetical protein
MAFLVFMIFGYGCLHNQERGNSTNTFPTPEVEYHIYRLTEIDDIDYLARETEKSEYLNVNLNIYRVDIDYTTGVITLDVIVRFHNQSSEDLVIKKPTPIRAGYHTNLRMVFTNCPFEVLDDSLITLIPDPLYNTEIEEFTPITPNSYYEYFESVEITLISEAQENGRIENCRVSLEYDNIYFGYMLYPDDWIPEREIVNVFSDLTLEDYKAWRKEQTLVVDIDAFIGRVTSNSVVISEYINLNE